VKLYYAVPCGKKCDYYTGKHNEEIWKDAELYGEPLKNYKVSNFGGIVKDDKFDSVKRFLNQDNGLIYVYIPEIKKDYKDGIELYRIIASTFSPPLDKKYCDEKGSTKHVHHWDNNSYNFNPDNMSFVVNHPNGQPHLNRENYTNWNNLIDKICKKEEL
jgi:hypothetical protein